MKAVVAAFNQEKALVGAFSVITNLRMELFEALLLTDAEVPEGGVLPRVPAEDGVVVLVVQVQVGVSVRRAQQAPVLVTPALS